MALSTLNFLKLKRLHWSHHTVRLSILFLCDVFQTPSRVAMATSTCPRKPPTAFPFVPTVRLGSVLGDEDKKNDVIWAGEKGVPAERNVVFFGGDVQDYVERMLAHRDNQRYAAWDLETMARLMVGRFPRSHVWVVKAGTRDRRMKIVLFIDTVDLLSWNVAKNFKSVNYYGLSSDVMIICFVLWPG